MLAYFLFYALSLPRINFVSLISSQKRESRENVLSTISTLLSRILFSASDWPDVMEGLRERAISISPGTVHEYANGVRF